jgi:hypothetical protein
MSTQKDLIEELQEQNKTLMDMMKTMRTEMREGKNQVDHDMIEEAMSVLYDPYEVQSPFRIIGDIPPDNEFPEGQALRWLNPRLRDGGKWMGWELLQWGDKYTGEQGEKLHGLISDRPARMKGPDRMDSYITRGDSVLGRLDKRIWHSRQVKRELEDARRRGELNSKEPIKLADGVYLTGDGIKKDPDFTKRKPKSAPDVPFDQESGDGTHRTHLVE